MSQKPLAEMTIAELEAEIAAARQEYATADYINQLHAWRIARDAASARICAGEAELGLRKVGENNG